MTGEIDRLRDELIFKAGNIAANLGLSKSMGQLYVALFLSPKEMSLNDLARVCRMSKGNVSINIRRLERWEAVEKVWGRDSRKDYYKANRDIIGFGLNHMMRVFSETVGTSEETVGSVKKKLKSLDASAIPDEDKEKLQFYRKSLDELDSLTGKIRKIMKNAKMMEKMIKNI